MNDLIDRQAAVKALEETKQSDPFNRYEYQNIGIDWSIDAIRALPSAQPDHIGEVTEMVGDSVSRHEVLKLLDAVPSEEFATKAMLIGGVKALPSAQRWIPCDRELPKPNEEDGNGFYKAYLVQDGRWMYVARWDGKYWVAWGYSTVLLNVVAWCPLPAPYRPEGDDKHEG